MQHFTQDYITYLILCYSRLQAAAVQSWYCSPKAGSSPGCCSTCSGSQVQPDCRTQGWKRLSNWARCTSRRHPAADYWSHQTNTLHCDKKRKKALSKMRSKICEKTKDKERDTNSFLSYKPAQLWWLTLSLASLSDGVYEVWPNGPYALWGPTRPGLTQVPPRFKCWHWGIWPSSSSISGTQKPNFHSGWAGAADLTSVDCWPLIGLLAQAGGHVTDESSLQRLLLSAVSFSYLLLDGCVMKRAPILL